MGNEPVSREECSRVHDNLQKDTTRMQEQLDKIQQDVTSVKTDVAKTQTSIEGLSDNLTQWREAVNTEMNARFADEKEQREKVNTALGKHVDSHVAWIAVMGGILVLLTTLFVLIDRILPQQQIKAKAVTHSIVTNSESLTE